MHLVGLIQQPASRPPAWLVLALMRAVVVALRTLLDVTTMLAADLLYAGWGQDNHIAAGRLGECDCRDELKEGL